MMKNLLILLTSARSNSAGDCVLSYTQKHLKGLSEFKISIIDFRKMPLPFFDYSLPPSSPDYEPTNKNVVNLIKAVNKSDRILILSAEYNYSYTAVLKNAIDWIPPEILKDKPFSFIGYGFSGGTNAIAKTRILLNDFIKANPSQIEANLRFFKEIDVNGGGIVDKKATNASLSKVIEELQN